MAEYTRKQKRKWLSLKYFGTTDNPGDDVNPYEAVPTFLESSVGSLRWGASPDSRSHSKQRFAYTFKKVLKLYGVILSEKTIKDSLQNEEKTNSEVVEGWIDQATFPSRKSK